MGAVSDVQVTLVGVEGDTGKDERREPVLASLRRALFPDFFTRVGIHGIEPVIPPSSKINHTLVVYHVGGIAPVAVQGQNHFPSADAMANIKHATFEFQAPQLQAPPCSPKVFLEGVLADLAWVQRLPEPVIHFSTNDFPLFMCAAFPNLLKFKMLIWGRYIWNWKGYDAKKFSVDDPDFSEVAEYGQQIFAAYEMLPSVEYWSPSLFDFTLKQAAYLMESGGFLNTASFTCLIAEFQAVLNRANQVAAIGVKSGGAGIQLFRTDLMSHGVMAMVTWLTGSRVYLMPTSPSSMYSDHPIFIEHANHWFKHLADTGVPLSGSNERERTIFFQQISTKIPHYPSAGVV